MKGGDRLGVYLVGFFIGTLIVSMLLMRRASNEDESVDPWAAHKEAAAATGVPPIPEAAPVALRKGRILAYGTLPSGEEPQERVWLLEFRESYPFVRLVEVLASGEIYATAADQVLVRLAEGSDVADLKAPLDELGLRMRMFNRKEEIAVVGVVSAQIDAVPETIAALQPWAHLFESVEPDVIQFRERPE